eukprot:CAMPEP_0179229518 /NCGR_PEP_ID=MMETSP0797-20121207/10373_1 /TAXON_ID=47934 /ORGANISM="Dinophysis acuminata, Strain DAEP01" /LENGTH=636 /DNA_ID=CAMNT_0020936585 /DNA_START=188 /DNA_END=2098 /DNA_ORIENTATION=+
MKQMMLPFATFSLYAALELFMTARANRPHEESYRDLKLDVGTSTGELELTLATGNLGGGKPQPEFEGGDWETNFGPFEKLLGGMILATGKGCNKAKWDEKYVRYTDKDAKITCDGGVFRFNNKEYTLPKNVGSVLGAKKIVETAVRTLETDANLPAANNMYKDEEGEALKPLFENEVDTKGGRFSTPEACLKERIAYPYFEAGFMELVARYQTTSRDKVLEQYLSDLRGTADDLNKGAWKVKPDTQRENQDVSMCAKKSLGDRANLFKEDGGLDWVSMAFWDFYVVQAYVQWITNEGKTHDALTSMEKTKEAETILGVAQHFMKKADIFFVQESGQDLCAKLGKTTVSHCEAMVGIDGKPTNTYDAAIFLTEGKGTFDTGATAKARTLYGTMVAQVIGGDMKDALKEYILQTGNQKKATAPRKKDKENPLVLGKVELAVATLGGVRVLLASAHPDSDGILCAFQLYLVKKVFEDLKVEPKLEYLIVGMDVNLMTNGDFDLKLADKKNGFNEMTFYPTTDTTKEENGITPYAAESKEWKASPVGKLGFDVLWPKTATVNKRRTFLQTQLNKAAKHDKVRKDMVFIYPTGNIVGTVPNADVCNKKEDDLAECYDGKEMYPRDFWPMDHCVSIAGVTLK